MADQSLATNMSGRPIRRPTAEDLLAADVSHRKSYDVVMTMPNGSRCAYADGKCYPIKDGKPDWDNPVPLPKAEGR